jgi:pentatricopeptide repeat protein
MEGALAMIVAPVSSGVGTVLEYFSLVWVELILGILSAIVYLAFSNRRVRNERLGKLGKPAGRERLTAQNLSRNLAALQTQGNASIPDSPRSSSADDTTQDKDVAGRVNKRIAMRANDIRSCGRNDNLKGAIKVFDKLGEQGQNTLVLNSLLDACVECHDLQKAIHYFNHAKELQLADVVTYNKMMKGYLSQGREKDAKQMLVELVSKGLANTTSYHGILNARVNVGDMRTAWKIVADMQKNGALPNSVTCAILLKGKLQSIEEVSRVLALVDAMDERMDEVLFMAVAEACVRIGRLDVLSRQMEKFKAQGSLGSLSAETYGSMIKAYGRARDTQKVWELWNQMTTDGVHLTSVTLGCMVEALVANFQCPEAWKLVQKMLKNESTKPLVNTVICSSILKGFAYTKDAEKVMAIYRDMQSHKIQPNTITFNTILNAFAQCGTMHYAPELLADMRSATPVAEPDIVTYSTLVKGYCHTGSLDRALQVFADLQAEGKCAPDEVMFNSLLGGCAKEFRLDEALQLVSQMRSYGVAPSNYTLSMLVKLMCRCRKLDQAFKVLEDISREYNFRINVQVYTCLIQGCFHDGKADKAMAVYDKLVAEKVVPDAMTYSVLVRGCLRAGNIRKAADLLKQAHGVGSGAPQKRHTSPGVNSGCVEEVVSALGGPKSEEGAALLGSLQYGVSSESFDAW